MNNPNRVATAVRQDSYTMSQDRDRALNSAIFQADIREGYEAYLEIVDVFYADDVEVSSEMSGEVICGKANLRSRLRNVLFPLHVMAEIAGLAITVRHAAIPGDLARETHSQCTVEFVAGSGSDVTLSWQVCRRWLGPRVIFEHHYDHRRNDGPLTEDDFRFITFEGEGLRKPS